MTVPGRSTGLAEVLALMLASALAIAGCGQFSPSSPPSPDITVFVAASLRDAMAAVGPAYADATGVRIETSADASTALRVQIEQGAKVDVFLSADTKNPDALLAGGLVIGGVLPFAHNSLAIIVPTSNPAGIESALDVGRSGVKIIAAGEGVPITAYAERLVDLLAAGVGDPGAFVAAYRANVVTREDNVKAVVAKIELGEGDAAIVYATDALAATGVIVIPIPPESNVLATYAGVVPTTALHPDAGRAFLDWMAGPSGQAILARFGFVPLVPASS